MASAASQITSILLLLLLAAVVVSAHEEEQPACDESSSGEGAVEQLSRSDLIKKSLAAQFLYAHNKVRAGYELPDLTWNRTLARYARQYARTRKNDCALLHSHNGVYGENMFWCKYSHWTPANVVNTWAEENQYYDFKNNQCLDDHDCGHFTQMIWKNTTQVGCGRVRCQDGRGYLFVCSYIPPGNYYNEGPFGGHFANSIV